MSPFSDQIPIIIYNFYMGKPNFKSDAICENEINCRIIPNRFYLNFIFIISKAITIVSKTSYNFLFMRFVK